MSLTPSLLRTSLAVLTAAALTLTGAVAAAASGPSTALDASTLQIADHVAITGTGTDFTIHAATGKNVTVDAHSRISDRGQQFTKRIKLNGTGTEASRSLHFTVDASEVPTEVFVAARSGSATADRAIALYGAAGEVGRVPALADVDTQAVRTERIAITAAGEYWLASPSSGVNVYFAQLGAFDAVPRAAWDSVGTPVITAVAPDPANARDLRVEYAGVLGADGGDVAYATLFDASGAVVDQALTATTGASGSLVVTPPASGDYAVEVRLTRFGEATPIASARAAVADYSLPLVGPAITGALTTAVSGATATVAVTWAAAAEAESYSIGARAAGAADFATVLTGVTGTSAEVPGLAAGTTVELRVVAHRGGEASTGPAVAVAVEGEVQRWQVADIGSNAGSGGSVTEHADGSITFDARASSTKLATSEDGFQYFYTQVDPTTENFTLTATFRVDDATAKDAQSGFGVLAVDTLVPGSSPARYFNSAGALVTRYNWGSGAGEWHDGTPGARFVHGYTGAPTDNTAGTRDMSDSVEFDPAWRADASGVKFQAGDEYTFALRRSNTGFHAIWQRDGQVFEEIQYDPEMLQQQDPERFFVGLAVARKIQVTVTEWDFTTIRPEDDEPAQEPPTEYVDATLAVDVTTTTPAPHLDVPLVANVFGTGQVLDASGTIVAGDVALSPGERVLVPVPLEPGANDLTVRLLPAAEQPHLGEREALRSTDPVDVPLSVTVRSYGKPGESIRVAPNGSPDGLGTAASPLDLHTAVAFAQPGQQVVLQGGTYALSRAVVVGRGHDGTEAAPITILSEPGSRAVLDLSQSPDGGLVLRGDRWHVYDLEITGSADKRKPMLIQGNHNVVERVESHHNKDTGIQISGSESEPPALWPTHNLVVSSVSHDNADVGGNDADGFAAKLTVGEGNVFRSDIAYNNIDDGWDLYAKSTTGPIGTVVIEDSVAYDNGWVQAEPTLRGEGNGFKLGGESMPGDHLLRNSVSFGNLGTGVTSNSGPNVRLDRITSVGNDRGVRLETNAATTAYLATGVISWRSPSLDVLALKQADASLLTDPSNAWNLGGASPVDASWFASTDLDGVRPTIAADGSVDLHGLLELTDAAPAATGARIAAIAEPTVIEVLPEVTVPLRNLVAPSVRGDAVKGATLGVEVGEWSHEASFTYRWLRDGSPVPGAVGQRPTYHVRGADVAHVISVEVTATVPGQDPVVASSTGVLVADRVPTVAETIGQVIRTVLDWLWGLLH
ncbi:hypothetical protein ACDF64_07890 [Agromyces sp. MMS24-JH15]|uniref:hypothetical protein n=1 Tax=Agromyces sp. MMS24-JH15 TaxID=3243765 RepID=UPI003749BC73